MRSTASAARGSGARETGSSSSSSSSSPSVRSRPASYCARQASASMGATSARRGTVVLMSLAYPLHGTRLDLEVERLLADPEFTARCAADPEYAAALPAAARELAGRAFGD